MIHNINNEAIEKQAREKKGFKLNRTVAGILTGLMIFSASACGVKEDTSSDLDNQPGISDVNTDYVSINDINALNVIINDNDCSDIYTENICQELEKRGLKFSFTRENEGINVNDALVITLDQQYYGGPGVVVLAPYENEGNNVSDALACAIEKEFSEDGIKMDGIFCGRTGYSNASKTGSNRVPTSTESSIDKDRDTIFTTICFGTKTPNQKVVADGIMSALARVVVYERENSNVDLIYNPNPGDGIEVVSNRFGCDRGQISSIVKVEGRVQMDESFINPNLNKVSSFSRPVSVASSQKTESVSFLH